MAEEIVDPESPAAPALTDAELAERIAAIRRKMALVQNVAGTFDPMVLAASIDACARVLIRAGLTTEDEIKRLGLEAQLAIMEAILASATSVAAGGGAKSRLA